MKKIYSLLFLAASLTAYKAQVFTNGTVYNYNVGDSIIEQYQHYPGVFFSPGPPLTTLRVITGKSFSLAQDTVFYTETRYANQYSWPCCPVVMGFTTSVNSFFVTDLNQSVISYTIPWGSPCQNHMDTTSVNSCSYQVHVISLEFDTAWGGGFCEPNDIKDTYINGIGFYKRYICNNCSQPGSGYETKHLYSHKVNQPPCGNRVSIITDLQNYLKNPEKLEVFPNPTAGNFHLRSSQPGKINIYSVSGELIRTADLNEGDNEIILDDYPTGIYFLSTTVNGKTLHTKIVKM